ncbi:MAG: tRNA uridine(34) 5-carboxymethylaminomethyl modification radical SAM/GNAT enzyme Elp3, partial [bacterium]|nr:tRNA uridine(34) 5-carboxymethylaminomethyl modification radical SAM/GNAT enzyme Elp3 [bacterium]
MRILLEKIILELSKGGFQTGLNLNCFKRKVAKKYGIACPKNIALLKVYHKLLREKRLEQNKGLEQALKTRPVRSLSGIVNVSLLTKPWPCKGKCLFCPSQKGLPKSYLKEEPACQRAILTKFSPKKQTSTRLLSLELTGHPIDKIELRIIGGTWHYYPLAYRKWFIKECFRACNNFTKAKNSKSKVLNSKQIPNNKIQMLKREQKKNETAKARIIGITIETRPDCINQEAIREMRELGITRVELGVQSVFDSVLQINQRGHGVADTVRATLLLKEAGFKVSYQLMPNLPKSNLRKDVLLFKEVFQNPSFRPDLIKIYPLALLKNTGVYRLYQQGKFKPYTEKQLLKLLIEIKKEIPLWVRIERIIRDIPKK